MIYSNLIYSLTIVTVALIGSLLIKKTWIRVVFVSVLYGCIVLTATVGMSEFRARIEQARAQGKSEDFIDGLAARDEQIQQARIEILVFSTGLVLLALGGWWAPLRGRLK